MVSGMKKVDHLIITPKNAATLKGITEYLSRLHNAAIEFGFFHKENELRIYPFYPSLTTEFQLIHGTWKELHREFLLADQLVESGLDLSIYYCDNYQCDLLRIEQEALQVSIKNSHFSVPYLLLLSQSFLYTYFDVWIIQVDDGVKTNEFYIQNQTEVETYLNQELNKLVPLAEKA